MPASSVLAGNRCRLLELPPELRMAIWEYVAYDETISLSQDEYPAVGSTTHPLLQVCTQIAADFLPVFLARARSISVSVSDLRFNPFVKFMSANRAFVRNNDQRSVCIGLSFSAHCANSALPVTEWLARFDDVSTKARAKPMEKIDTTYIFNALEEYGLEVALDAGAEFRAVALRTKTHYEGQERAVGAAIMSLAGVLARLDEQNRANSRLGREAVKLLAALRHPATLDHVLECSDDDDCPAMRHVQQCLVCSRNHYLHMILKDIGTTAEHGH